MLESRLKVCFDEEKTHDGQEQFEFLTLILIYLVASLQQHNVYFDNNQIRKMLVQI